MYLGFFVWLVRWAVSGSCLISYHCHSPYERVQYNIAILVYTVLHGLAPQYLGPLNYVADSPGRRPLRSAGTNRLAVQPPVKLTTVANQPGFPGCRPTDMERSARRRDFSRIVIHLPSATQNSPVCQILFLISPRTGLHLTSLSSGPSSSLYYLRQFKNPGLID